MRLLEVLRAGGEARSWPASRKQGGGCAVLFAVALCCRSFTPTARPRTTQPLLLHHFLKPHTRGAERNRPGLGHAAALLPAWPAACVLCRLCKVRRSPPRFCERVAAAAGPLLRCCCCLPAGCAASGPAHAVHDAEACGSPRTPSLPPPPARTAPGWPTTRAATWGGACSAWRSLGTSMAACPPTIW